MATTRYLLRSSDENVLRCETGSRLNLRFQLYTYTCLFRTKVPFTRQRTRRVRRRDRDTTPYTGIYMTNSPAKPWPSRYIHQKPRTETSRVRSADTHRGGAGCGGLLCRAISSVLPSPHCRVHRQPQGSGFGEGGGGK